MAKRPNEIAESGRTVAANVRRLRRAQGITMGDLATRLDEDRPIPLSGLSKLENCQRRVDVDDLVAIARVLNVEPAALLSPALICDSCNNEPPPGFTCRACGAEA